MTGMLPVCRNDVVNVKRLVPQRYRDDLLVNNLRYLEFFYFPREKSTQTPIVSFVQST